MLILRQNEIKEGNYMQLAPAFGLYNKSDNL